MKSLLSILFKYTILFTTVVVTLVFIFTNTIGYKEIKYFFGILAALYIIVCCVEAELIASVIKGTRKFIYLTDGFISKRFLKIFFFTCAGGILLFPHSIVRYMAFLCFMIAFTELFVTLWRYLRKLCFIAFEGDTIVLVTNKIFSVHASSIEKIETRHGITYFVYNNNEAITLRTDMMREKEAFKLTLAAWVTENNLQSKVVATT